MNKIIGFAGRKRSGKGEMSKYIQNSHPNNSKIFTIAKYIKTLCADVLNVSVDKLNIMKDDNSTINLVKNKDYIIELLSNELSVTKEKIIELWDNKEITNVREMIQFFGTDIIRKINYDWHINKTITDIKDYFSTGDNKYAIIDDIRFPNECEALYKLNAEIFFICRPNYLNVSNHNSETSLKWSDFNYDHIIINDFDTPEEFVNSKNKKVKPNDYKNIINYLDFLNYDNHNNFYETLSLKPDNNGKVEIVIKDKYKNIIFEELCKTDNSYKTNPLLIENLKLFL